MITADGISTFDRSSFKFIKGSPFHSITQPAYTITYDYVRNITICHLIIAFDQSEKFFFTKGSLNKEQMYHFINEVFKKRYTKDTKKSWKMIKEIAKMYKLIESLRGLKLRSYEEYYGDYVNQTRETKLTKKRTSLEIKIRTFLKRVMISNDHATYREMRSINRVIKENKILYALEEIYDERIAKKKNRLVCVNAIADKVGVSWNHTRYILDRLKEH